MFQKSAVMVINKIDLLPHVDFDMDKAKRDAGTLNPELNIFEVSCKTAEGLDQWFSWLTARIETFRQTCA